MKEMVKQKRTKVISLRETEDPAPWERVERPQAEDGAQVRSPRKFPVVSTLPKFPAAIPDELLDYYGWVFCQGGFANMQMTFEQFLAVVAVLAPAGLFPEYEEEVQRSTPRAIDVAPRA